MNPTLLPATWSGDLYVTDGPWFGTSSYNPASVVNRKVGTISWYAQSGDSGSLTYSVDGVSVSKTIQRFSLTLDDFTGSFLGGYSRTSSGCFNSANNVTLDSGGIVTVTQNGQNATVTAPGGSCTFTGPLTQSGQFGRIDGTYTCTGGDNGSAALFEMNVGISAFSARVLAISSSLGCITSGNIGGVRRR